MHSSSTAAALTDPVVARVVTPSELTAFVNASEVLLSARGADSAAFALPKSIYSPASLAVRDDVSGVPQLPAEPAVTSLAAPRDALSASLALTTIGEAS